MLAKLKIKNKMIILFSIFYLIYIVVILAYTYKTNVKILKESLRNRVTENFYQLSYNLADDIRVDNIYKINQKIKNLPKETDEIAYVIVYDNEKNILSKNLKEVPKKLQTFDNYGIFKEYNSSKGEIIDYVDKIQNIDIGYIRIGFYTKSIYQKTYNEFLNILFLNTILFLILIILANYILKLIEKPIDNLTFVTNEITQSEEYNDIVEKSYYPKDFHVLIDAINQMIITNKKNKKLKNTLLNKVFKVQEDERKILSRELHDEVSQTLASLLFLVTNIKLKEVDTVKKERLDKVIFELKKSLKDIRNIAVNLRPPLIEEHGIIEAIKKHIEEYIKLYKIDVKFLTNIKNIENDNFNITIYRIIQEALTNIKKHSKATKVEIKFEKNFENIVLSIADNGTGLDNKKIIEAKEKGRLGIYGIKERVEEFFGNFYLDKNDKYSTIIVCKFKNKYLIAGEYENIIN